jgi:hypothetical protein
MALDSRLMPSAASSSSSFYEGRVHSSASTPSLRSRDAASSMPARLDGGGNVKVVVRVRAFLQRGKNPKYLLSSPFLHE